MLNKLNTGVLVILLVVLGGITAWLFLSDSKNNRNTFKKDIVEIDTAKITSIKLYPKSEEHNEISIVKSGDSWKVSMEGKKTVDAGNEMISGALTELSKLRAKRLVAKEEKWDQYEVTEEKGTRVVIEEGNETTLDLIIGKFSFNQQARSANSFVRLNGEDAVYMVEGFLDMSFNRKFNSFRNQELVSTPKDNFQKFTFNYKDSAFVLQKNETGKWMVNDVMADSAEVEKYINTMANLRSGNFIDDISVTGPATRSVQIELNNGSSIDIKAYQGNEAHPEIITSTKNTEGIFSGKDGNLSKRVFVNKEKFLPEASN